MKLKTFLLSLATFVCAIAQADDLARVMLMHNGQSTIFAGDKITEAMTKAADGDTIYLSEGHFPEFTINKRVFVRGAGLGTVVSNYVDVSILNAPVLTSPVLESVKIAGVLRISKNCTNLIIRKCEFDTFQNNASSLPNALVDRCRCGVRFNVSGYMTDFYVRNTYIHKLAGTSLMNNQCNFINCSVYQADDATASGRFLNCVIRDWDNIKSSILVKTLVYTHWSSVYDSTVTQDCFFESSSNSSWLTSTELATKGYNGIDDTIVGRYGGTTPYGNFSPAVPNETQGTISVDNENRKVNVEMEISSK